MYIFDVCDTLYFSNTTFDFIKFVFEKENNKFKLFLVRIYTYKYSPLFISFFLIQKVSNIDYSKLACLNLMKGYSKNTLEQYANQFYKEHLVKNKIRKTHKLLEKAIFENQKICLVSASIEPVVKEIALQLNICYKSSELNYVNEIFTGKLSKELKGKKQEEVSVLNSEGEDLIVVSDNFSDRILMEKATKCYAVIYKPEALEFWKDLNPNFIKLYK